MPRGSREPHDADVARDADASAARVARRPAQVGFPEGESALRADGLTAAGLRQLQRTAGNRAVQRMLVRGELRLAPRPGRTPDTVERAGETPAITETAEHPGTASPNESVQRLM